MTRVKSYDNQHLSDLEKNINEFLKKEDVKRLIDIKFTAISKNDVDKYAALIIYEVEEEENSNPVKEDPQIYE
ncbi:MAG: sporulation protein Cse60 [Candidatus Nitrosocosmicus sp.]|jgi:hypothetical protein|uniref:sporulation protein Cse60 n=1 Tax=Candidatus Nitrosocosmicus agrestis TaxID=2563600 RepID=UPI00122DF31D|nr:sporulation protein Cse60 [Candidatus Nitrosocosmicus sp. SS]MDR4490327.1 sporulation protein Cse60 [Candidatus Nitrosocosmicus sp.]HET8794733.1 sporulation protein Cse60 [Nitrososphaeraceae archaeon]KAA2278869.1 sporulation protein Cse60 [Candidatus Nitrosocosmicus sp. SS]KAF0867546.1 sporulation protein Cse60 [Candidatus Nitrosocosmicus sp. SS]HET6589555.1 sporulation protein Cse60 [Candidatus Nitrosocosmicus sp.]